MKSMAKQIATIILALGFLISCAKTYSNLGREAVSTERLDIRNTEELTVWETNDLAVHYTLRDEGNSFTLRGYVEIKNSISYSFPRVKHFSLYVYLLDNKGIATSRYITRPRMSTYNVFPEQSIFGITIPKDQGTTMFAFGYFGGFMDSENDFFGGRFGGINSTDWEIYHSPFS